MRLWLFKLTLLIALALAGCNGAQPDTAVVIELSATATASPIPPTATLLPTATATPSPPPTATPSPTETPQPTTTPTVTPTAATLPISLEEEYTAVAAGFSFRSPPGYVLTIRGQQVSLTDPTGNMHLSLMGILIFRAIMVLPQFV
jgi:hypothetical protein